MIQEGLGGNSRRLLLAIPTLEGGGAERQAAYLARQLDSHGWRVAVALLRLGPNVHYLAPTNVSVSQLTHRSHYDPRLIFELRRVYTAFRPHIIHTWLGMMDVLGGILRWTTRTVWLASERGSFHENVAKERARRRIVSLAADAVVTNSEAGRRYVNRYISDKVPVTVIPNGIPVDELADAQPFPKSVLGLSPDSEIVLFAGRFSREKNLETLLMAVPMIAQVRPHVRVVCCGIGPLHAEAVRRSRQLGVEERTVFPGYVRDLPRWMRTSDVFIAPSHFEGNPNVLLESMAAGVPLVASDIPAHREVVSEETATLFDPRSPRDLARAVVACLQDPSTALRKAALARSTARGYDLDAMASKYERLYEKLLERRPARRWRLQKMPAPR